MTFLKVKIVKTLRYISYGDSYEEWAEEMTTIKNGIRNIDQTMLKEDFLKNKQIWKMMSEGFYIEHQHGSLLYVYFKGKEKQRDQIVKSLKTLDLSDQKRNQKLLLELYDNHESKRFIFIECNRYSWKISPGDLVFSKHHSMCVTL